MHRIEWDESLATGVEEIDGQHKEIFRRFKALLKACEQGRSREEAAGLLQFMNSYIIHHFSEEEGLQRMVGYPDFVRHSRDHEELSRKFQRLEGRLKMEGASVQLVMQTGKLLSELLFEHIQVEDRALAKFIKCANREAIAKSASPDTLFAE